MRAGLRFRLGGCMAVVLAASGAISAVPAAAAGSLDPQTTNVPSLAWRGEQVRLVKCAPVLSSAGRNASADFVVEDWSGDPFNRPQLATHTTAFFTGTGDHRGETCVRATFLSQYAGMAVIKLKVSDNSGTVILDHQFLAGWMNIEKPTLSGGGDFVAGGAGRELMVNVKGDLPLNGMGGIAGSVVLPDQWAALAAAMAIDQNPNDSTPWMRWDIHDDQSTTEGHAGANECTPRSLNGIDAVDNCAGGLSFSSLLGLSEDPSIGPFDPERPSATLLPNGSLDSGDAPMPAARIDVTIAPNSGSATDIGGVGFLTAADKGVDYSRNGTGLSTAHNLYAPFYSAYIPATTRHDGNDAEASGVDGPASGNDFPGFLVDGAYDYWQIAHVLSTATGGNTGCLLNGLPGDPRYRQLPSGDQSVIVYSDEHGEARVVYNPGTGAFFDNLGAIKNANGGCDLQGIDVIGTSSITATARYPYQPVHRAPGDQASDAVSASVHSLFNKVMADYAKGTGADNSVARIVVAHAQDITGAPFAGEVVCFMSDNNSEGMIGFFGITGDDSHSINLAGSRQVSDPLGAGRLCIATNAEGNAAVEVFNSNGGTVNVIGHYVDEGLLRHVFANFNTGGTTGGGAGTPGVPTTPAPTGAPSTPGTTGAPAPGTAGTTAPAPSQIPATMPATTKPTVAKAAYRLMTARLVSPLRSGRYVQVRVNGPAGKKVAVHVRLIGAHGKTLGKVTRWVPTNHTTKLNVKITKKVKAVKVTL